MGKGEKLKCYAIGAIQYAWKKGKKWRTDLKKVLDPLGIELLIPNTIEEELTGKSEPEEIFAERYGWKRSGKWSKFDKQMWMIKVADLKYGVLGCDFVVLYWQIGIEKGGTLDEFYCAFKCGVPVFIVINQPKINMNDWVKHTIRQMELEQYSPYVKEIFKAGLTKFAHTFPSFKALAKYLEEHKEELLARKRILQKAGIIEARMELAPLFLKPGALFDFIMHTPESLERYREWLKMRPEYHIEEEVERKIQDIFEGKHRRVTKNGGNQKES